MANAKQNFHAHVQNMQNEPVELMNVSSIEHGQFYHPPRPAPFVSRMLKFSDQIIFLKTLYSIISWSGDCSLYYLLVYQ